MIKKLTILGVGITVLITLRVLGLLPSWHYVAGIGVIAGVAYLVIQIPPSYSSWRALAGVILVGSTLFLFIYPLMYHNTPAPIKKELEAMKKTEAMRIAEKLHQSGEKTVEIRLDICNKEQERENNAAIEAYNKGVAAKASITIIRGELDRALKKAADNREACGKDLFVGTLEESPSKKLYKAIGDMGNLEWFITLLTIVGLATIVSYTTDRDEVSQASFLILVMWCLYVSIHWIGSIGFEIKPPGPEFSLSITSLRLWFWVIGCSLEFLLLTWGINKGKFPLVRMVLLFIVLLILEQSWVLGDPSLMNIPGMIK